MRLFIAYGFDMNAPVNAGFTSDYYERGIRNIKKLGIAFLGKEVFVKSF